MEPLIAERAVVTRPPFESIALHRIQLRLTTAIWPRSDNDQGVYVQLHNADGKFYMYKGKDNWEAGDVDTYDILSPTVNYIKNIQFIKLGVKGSDDWRIRKMELLLNDYPIPVFVKDFGITGVNITLNQPLVITGQQLRQYAGWANSSSNTQLNVLPAVLPKAKLLSLVEASIGNQINYTPGLDWGEYDRFNNTKWGPVVEVSFKSFNTLTFDLDLQRRIDNFPNPEVDVNFDLVFKCVNGRIVFDIKNVSYGTNLPGYILVWLRTIIPPLLGYALKDPLGNIAGILSKFLDYSIEFNPDVNLPQQACRLILVQPNCDIRLR
jgi:hypothetical protein